MGFTPPNLAEIWTRDLAAKVKASVADLSGPPLELESWLYAYDDGEKVGLLGPGNLGVVSGPSKSNKSYVLSCILASYFDKGPEMLNFKLDVPSGVPVYLIDTEQSDYYAEMAARRALHMSGQKSSEFPHFKLLKWRRNMDPIERLAALAFLLEKHKTPNEHGKTGCVILLDGIADLVDDTNSLLEAKWLVASLMSDLSESGSMMLTVLHANEKGQDKGVLRGALGSELQRKEELNISVAKKVKKKKKSGKQKKQDDDDEEEEEEDLRMIDYEVSTPVTRGRPIRPFLFKRGDKYPQYHSRVKLSKPLF